MPESKTIGAASPARRAAFDILRRVAQEDSYASTLIAALPDGELSREDRALVQELVLGALRWQATLDYFIEHYAGREIEKLDLPLVIALRLGIYQIRFLSRIPASAAVNESVKLVKRARLTSAAGLANAVLRRAAEHSAEPAGADISNDLDRAAVELSHPRWMIEQWTQTLGEDQTRRLALANNQSPVIAFRVNTIRSSVDDAIEDLKIAGVESRPSNLTPGAFVAERGSGLALTRAAKEGLIYIQDEASQMVSLLLDAKPGQRVLDLCAAPGSKSTHIAAMTNNEAWILACDIHPKRLAILGESSARLGVSNLSLLALDAARSLPFLDSAPKFDRVLLDAPCSGTGTLRQNPEIKWRLASGDIARLAKLQFAMLENAATMVSAGGRLVYSTCSMEPEEGEQVIGKFLASRFGDAFRVVVPEGFRPLATPEGFIRTYPHVSQVDGFFAAVLDRLG